MGHLRWIDDHGHAALAVSGLGAVDPDRVGVVDGDRKGATLRCAQSAAPGLVCYRAVGIWYVFSVGCRLESRVETARRGNAADRILVHVVFEESHQRHHTPSHSRRRKG